MFRSKKGNCSTGKHHLSSCDGVFIRKGYRWAMGVGGAVSKLTWKPSTECSRYCPTETDHVEKRSQNISFSFSDDCLDSALALLFLFYYYFFFWISTQMASLGHCTSSGDLECLLYPPPQLGCVVLHCLISKCGTLLEKARRQFLIQKAVLLGFARPWQVQKVLTGEVSWP